MTGVCRLTAVQRGYVYVQIPDGGIGLGAGGEIAHIRVRGGGGYSY